MLTCNNTDTPVLNPQEGPCVQGSLLTDCIFYGKAIEIIGTQDTANLFTTIQSIVVSLGAESARLRDIEEVNRAQWLQIESLQSQMSSLQNTFEALQLAVDNCCPQP